MLLLIHILIALVSLVIAGVLLARPSRGLVKVQLGLIGGTLLSGTILVIEGASLLHLCVSGLLFTSLSVAAVVVAMRRLRLVPSRVTR